MSPHPATGPPAVVLAIGSNGLGAARSLALAGVEVTAICDNRKDPTMWSRYPALAVARDAEGGYAESWGRALLRHGPPGAVVIPTADRHIEVLLEQRESLESRFRLVVPNSQVTRLLLDKHEETARIRELGIPVPRTLSPLPEDPAEIEARLRFPVLVKPRTATLMEELGAKNLRLDDRDRLREFYRLGRRTGALLVQEIVEGDDDTLWVAHCTFDREHRMVSAMTFRRLFLHPPHYGVTTYARSERNVEVLALTERIGNGLRYEGPMMAEFKYDARDDDYKYIEINPRLGLCNWFDTCCGVNTAYAAYLAALGLEDPDLRRPQREGVYFRSLYNDVRSRLKDGQGAGAIAASYLRQLGRPHVSAFLDRRDPVPGLAQGWVKGAGLVGAAARRLLGGQTRR